MDIVEELYRVVDALANAEVAHAVCGGLAVTIHGRPRMTIDIDVIIPAAKMSQAIEAVAQVGFDLESGWVGLPASNLGVGRLFRVTKVEDNQFLTLDLLEADSESNPILVDRETIVVGNRQISVVSKNSLIAMKTGSGRTQDRLDIEMLSDEAE